jgi:hypothetical protein
MRYHLHLMTGFKRQDLELFLQNHVNDDFVIKSSEGNDHTLQRQQVVLAFVSERDRDHIRSVLGVRGHRLAPRGLRVERVSHVA